jgi:hypothetical protein
MKRRQTAVEETRIGLYIPEFGSPGMPKTIETVRRLTQSDVAAFSTCGEVLE